MNYKKFFLIFFFLCSCTTNQIAKKENTETNIYTNRGFALLYNEDLKKRKIINRKIDERSLTIFQRNLKKSTIVKVTNPINNISILANVGDKSTYPLFYNSVISKRIFDELRLSINEPYVEIVSISENSSFIAKKAKMFDEEKKVAEKVPVEDISINDLSINKVNNKKKKKKDNFNYIIKVADFYYENTAIMMQKRIRDELNLKNSKVNKISNTIYRVYFGPYDNLKSLKKTFDDITPLNFENIEIIKL